MPVRRLVAALETRFQHLVGDVPRKLANAAGRCVAGRNDPTHHLGSINLKYKIIIYFA